MKKLLYGIVLAATLPAAQPGWLEMVDPLITPAEKKVYRSLDAPARAKFEQEFWADKAITSEEYFKRLQYVDSKFGSTKPGSGANTDPGRVYLAIGPPDRITRVPSSRIFVPLEIWYYDSVPAIQLSTELRLIFYQKNSIGLPRLYSPSLDTIRALLVPQAATARIFGPNDDITEAKLRQNLNVGPAEDEVVSASVNIATGIKYSANDQILGQITSPLLTLGKAARPEVKSKFIVTRPKLDIVTTESAYGGMQVDLGLETRAQQELDLQVQEGPVSVYESHLRLQFPKPEPVRYTHRLDLLPGSYRVLFTIDGTTHPYAIEVKERAAMSEIFRADAVAAPEHSETPFRFDGRQFDPAADGKLAAVIVAKPGMVTWTIRKGVQVIWKSVVDAGQIATVELPSGLAPGMYKLEAASESDSKSNDYVAGDKRTASAATVVSFNANLAPALRFALVGHQWLLRGNLDLASRSLQASTAAGTTKEAAIEMARVDAFSARYDEARARLRPVLASQPGDFDALSTYAYVEAQLQDFEVAVDFYRRALAVQDSPAIRLALEKLVQR